MSGVHLSTNHLDCRTGSHDTQTFECNNLTNYEEIMLAKFNIANQIDYLFNDDKCLVTNHYKNQIKKSNGKKNLYRTRSCKNDHELSCLRNRITKKIKKQKIPFNTPKKISIINQKIMRLDHSAKNKMPEQYVKAFNKIYENNDIPTILIKGGKKPLLRKKLVAKPLIS